MPPRSVTKVLPRGVTKVLPRGVTRGVPRGITITVVSRGVTECYYY